MNTDVKKEVYFHVGLGKTGTTYLQYRVFPKLKGIKYIQRTNYREFKYVKLIENSTRKKFLVSNEFDKQLEEEAHKIASKYPGAKIIIVLRRQDSWIASQYRRFVKNGFAGSFEEFIDVENNEGIWDRQDMFFHRKLVMLEEIFGSRPLVLFQDELIKDPHAFIGKLCSFTGTEYDKDSISLKRKHSSYNEKQLKFRRQLSARNNSWPGKRSKTYWVRKIQNFLKMPKRIIILYGAWLVPSKCISDEPLISVDSMEKIRAYYEEDWKLCLNY